MVRTRALSAATGPCSHGCVQLPHHVLYSFQNTSRTLLFAAVSAWNALPPLIHFWAGLGPYLPKKPFPIAPLRSCPCLPSTRLAAFLCCPQSPRKALGVTPTTQRPICLPASSQSCGFSKDTKLSFIFFVPTA